MAFVRNNLVGLTTLFGLCGSTFVLRSHMVNLSEEHEARMVSLMLSSYIKMFLTCDRMNWKGRCVDILGG